MSPMTISFKATNNGSAPEILNLKKVPSIIGKYFVIV